MVTFLALLSGLVLLTALRVSHGSLTRRTSHGVTYEMSLLPPQSPLCSVAACLGCHVGKTAMPGRDSVPSSDLCRDLRGPSVSHRSSPRTSSSQSSDPQPGDLVATYGTCHRVRDGTQLTCFPPGSAAFLYNRQEGEGVVSGSTLMGRGNGISRTDHALQTHSPFAKGAFHPVPSGCLPSSASRKAGVSKLHQEQKGRERWHCGRKTQGAFQPPQRPPPSLPSPAQTDRSHGDPYRADR